MGKAGQVVGDDVAFARDVVDDTFVAADELL